MGTPHALSRPSPNSLCTPKAWNCLKASNLEAEQIERLFVGRRCYLSYQCHWIQSPDGEAQDDGKCHPC